MVLPRAIENWFVAIINYVRKHMVRTSEVLEASMDPRHAEAFLLSPHLGRGRRFIVHPPLLSAGCRYVLGCFRVWLVFSCNSIAPPPPRLSASSVRGDRLAWFASCLIGGPDDFLLELPPRVSNHEKSVDFPFQTSALLYFEDGVAIDLWARKEKSCILKVRGFYFPNCTSVASL